MRYGIVTDVHGNLEALQACLTHLEQQNIDAWVFLGDAVGYGANPDEVCTLLRERCSISIVGNHDAAVAERMNFDAYYEAAKEAIVWCRGQLSEANRAWLGELPYKAEAQDVVFCHGAPVTPEAFDYVFGVEDVNLLISEADALASVSFIGHSHLAIAFEIEGEQVASIVESEFVCDPARRYIITVGSVGQPRDRDPRACCGVYDSETRRFAYHRVPYDIETARQKILDAGLSPIFADRLLLGV